MNVDTHLATVFVFLMGAAAGIAVEIIVRHYFFARSMISAARSEFDERNKPAITQVAPLSLLVCCPAEWTDQEILAFVERESETEEGWEWVIRKPKEGQGPMKCDRRDGFVHVVIDKFNIETGFDRDITEKKMGEMIMRLFNDNQEQQ